MEKVNYLISEVGVPVPHRRTLSSTVTRNFSDRLLTNCSSVCLKPPEVANENLDPSSVSLAEIQHISIGGLSRSQSEAGQNFVGSPAAAYLQIFSSLFDGCAAKSAPALLHEGYSYGR